MIFFVVILLVFLVFVWLFIFVMDDLGVVSIIVEIMIKIKEDVES